MQALTNADPAHMPTTTFTTSGGCPPLPGVNNVSSGSACDELWNYSLRRIQAPRVKTVVFSAYWESYFGYDAEGDRTTTLVRTGPRTTRQESSLQLAASLFQDLGAVIRSLHSHGKRVFIILSNPGAQVYDPRQMLSRLSGEMHVRNLDRRALDRAQPVLGLLRTSTERAGATVIDPTPYFCDSNTCPTTTATGEPLYKDSNHLRYSFASRYSSFIDQIYRDR